MSVHESGGVTEGLSRLPALGTGHMPVYFNVKSMSHSDIGIFIRILRRVIKNGAFLEWSNRLWWWEKKLTCSCFIPTLSLNDTFAISPLFVLLEERVVPIFTVEFVVFCSVLICVLPIHHLEA